MAFLGADTEELREAGNKCQEGKETTDEVIAYLRALIIALRAASFFTGGASAAYAEYLQGTVVPWLEKVSQALGLMAQVLMANAQAQDDASDGRTVDLASLPTYSTPGGALPSQRIEVWDGQLVPETGGIAVTTAPEPAPLQVGTPDETAGPTDFGAPTIAGTGADVAGGSPTSPSAAGVGAFSVPHGSSGAGPGSSGPDTVGLATGGLDTGGLGTGGLGTGGLGTGGLGVSSADGTTELGTSGTVGGAVPGAAAGGGSAGAGSPGLGGGAAGDGTVGDPGELSSYSTGSVAGAGTGVPDAASMTGSPGPGAAGDPVAVEGAESSYGAASAIAGGAAAAGLGGAALAGRDRKDGTDRIDQLGTTHGRGSRGEGVRELQERLTAAGYDTRGADGKWGPDTQRAYEAYREANPLPLRHGSGFTSPDGFDYQQITGVRGNPNVTPEFLRETEAVAQRIGARPEHLMAVMSFETGGEFGADTPTKADGGTAVGLIQFTPVAREQVGVTREQLMAMSPTEQLTYVEKYFDTRRGPHLSTVEGLYTSVLYGTGHTDPDHVLFREGGRGWDGNKGLDASRDGQVTVREAAARVNRALAGR